VTINADEHPFMRNFHKPQDEKRSVVILSPDRYDDWLNAAAAKSADFLRPWPVDQLSDEASQEGLSF
jgi:putative SOS response-associated peptidase YedK